MQWQHKGVSYTISVEPMGPFFLATARVPSEGMFVRVRPFSALERSQEKALELLKDQVRREFKKVPESPEVLNS